MTIPLNFGREVDILFKLQKLNIVKVVEAENEKEKLITNGFMIIEDEKTNGEGSPNYSEMTVQDLQNLCKENGLTGYSNFAKEDLIKFIQENLKK